jgi:nitrogen fixation/metabolism regulation signal transduction histidine kinase
MELANLRRFILVQGLVVLLLVGTAFFTATNLDRSVALTLELTSLQEVYQATEIINAALEEERIVIGQYPLTGDDDLLNRFADAQLEYDKNWQIIVENHDSSQAEIVAEIETNRNTYLSMLEGIVEEYQSNPTNNESASLLSGAINYYLQNLGPKFSDLSEPTQQSLRIQVEQEKARATNLSIFSRAALGLSVIVGVAVVVQVIVAMIFSRRLIKSMQDIVDAANAISRGDMEAYINVNQIGEIGDLARAIERMRASLRAAIERLRRTM